MILIRLAALNQHRYCIMEGVGRQLDAAEAPQVLSGRRSFPGSREWRVADDLTISWLWVIIGVEKRELILLY
jgi:hypothetical protein